jgi:hypothetical protein
VGTLGVSGRTLSEFGREPLEKIMNELTVAANSHRFVHVIFVCMFRFSFNDLRFIISLTPPF